MIPISFQRRLARGLVRFLKLGGYGVSVYDQGDGVSPSRDTALFQSVYTGHVWAYAGIYAIAAAAAGLPIRVMRKIDDKTSEVVEDHPFSKLLEEPNEFMTGYDLIELSMIFAESTGYSYWLLDNGEAAPLSPGSKLPIAAIKEIWPLPPGQVKVLPDPKGFIVGYKFEPSSGKVIKLQPSEVVAMRYPNPTNLWGALGSLEPAKADIQGDLYADKFNNNFFRNGGLPVAFLKTDQVLQPDQRLELRAEWAKLYQGVANAHKVAFLEGGTDLQVLQQTRKDMEFVDLSREKRTKILGALGVPPVIVGLDTAKYDNAEQQKAIFWENTMLPKLRKFERLLTKRLHQAGEPDEIFVMFDTSGVKALQGDFRTQAETAKSWWSMGVPANELIPIFGPPNMELFDGGDESFPGGGASPADPTEDMPGLDPEGTPEDAPPPDEEADPSKKSAWDPNKAIDDARWRRFIATQEPYTRKLRAEIRKLFAGQRRRIIARIRKGYKAAPISDEKADFQTFILNVHEESDAWTKKLKPLIRSLFEKLGAETIHEFSSGIDFSVNNPRAVAFLDTHVPKFTFEVNQTSMERIRLLIAEKIRLGATQKELTDAVGQEFDFFERYRSARIARTESGIAGNAGINEGLIQSGVKKKRWLSSRDEKVRDSHAAADGQEVAITDPFDVGGFLLEHPGDPKGPAGEIINCRCSMRGIIGENE